MSLKKYVPGLLSRTQICKSHGTRAITFLINWGIKFKKAGFYEELVTIFIYKRPVTTQRTIQYTQVFEICNCILLISEWPLVLRICWKCEWLKNSLYCFRRIYSVMCGTLKKFQMRNRPNSFTRKWRSYSEQWRSVILGVLTNFPFGSNTISRRRKECQ